MAEELAAVVFQRTVLANETLVKTPTVVPLELRTLLLAVDGRSTVAQYVPFLSHLVPLTPKLQSLESLGFLCRLPAQGRHQMPAAALPAGTAALQNSPAPPAVETLESLATVFQSSAANTAPELALPGTQPMQAVSFDAEIARLEQQMGTRQSVPPSELPTLAGMLLDMEQFVGLLPGLDGLPVALMLSQIQSPEQLALEIDDYAEWLASHGARGEAHVQQLRAQLRRLGC